METINTNINVPNKKVEEDEETFFNTPKVIKLEPEYYACDNASTLYILQQNNELLTKGNGYYHKISAEESK